MRVHSGVHFAIVVIGALVACEHTEPFRPGAYGSSGPLHPGVVARLTFNPGQDLMPAWVPGSDVIVYTAERLDRSDHDRCLAFMPASGGAITRYICGTTLGDDSLNVYEETAVSADGQIVYVRASNTRALAETGDTLYFPLAGDSQFHRYVFSAGRADTVFDFGAGRLVRDVRVASGRLIAIVDGR